MDAQSMGAMIRTLRMERGMTQAELAERLHLSDKAVSKWERGAGCPDIAAAGAGQDAGRGCGEPACGQAG